MEGRRVVRRLGEALHVGRLWRLDGRAPRTEHVEQHPGRREVVGEAARIIVCRVARRPAPVDVVDAKHALREQHPSLRAFVGSVLVPAMVAIRPLPHMQRVRVPACDHGATAVADGPHLPTIA